MSTLNGIRTSSNVDPLEPMVSIKQKTIQSIDWGCKAPRSGYSLWGRGLGGKVRLEAVLEHL